MRIQTARRRAAEVRANVVVDASGQSGMLHEQVQTARSGIRVLNKGAIWTYWEGAYRDTGRDEGATIVIADAEQDRAGSGTSRCMITSESRRRRAV